ncbi:hypothetical protein PUMCH_004493 [Australozyma saopauloensis]|uniref:protein-tyrosine-phosphatase n=1 Tax=Australozyma saopauloensis TaxID=291208 RepID=A0AAX4HH84_9ASCO|nr:hypothetical protein PUMCH_004493 [[Candida] saopauloensis]
MVQRILGNIYLSSFEPIENEVNLKEDYGVTHVLSVLSGLLPSFLEEYLTFQIDITDEPTSNLIDYLDKAMEFMDEALCGDALNSEKHKGTVLVHCAQGQSRSVAVVIAYLMYKYKLTYKQALHAVKRKVPDAEPNSGFVKQLALFQEMGCKVDPNHSGYRAFIVENSLELDPSGSLLQQSGFWQRKEPQEASDVPPSPSNEPQKDVGEQEPTAHFKLRCKRCRNVLAQETDVEAHEIPDADSRQSQFIRTVPNSRRIISAVDGSKTCSHYFMKEPIPWMDEELSKQDLEGKFACSKCAAKIGGYSWKGSRCSCGKWMIPALHLQSAKVDLMRL